MTPQKKANGTTTTTMMLTAALLAVVATAVVTPRARVLMGLCVMQKARDVSRVRHRQLNRSPHAARGSHGLARLCHHRLRRAPTSTTTLLAKQKRTATRLQPLQRSRASVKHGRVSTSTTTAQTTMVIMIMMIVTVVAVAVAVAVMPAAALMLNRQVKSPRVMLFGPIRVIRALHKQTNKLPSKSEVLMITLTTTTLEAHCLRVHSSSESSKSHRSVRPLRGARLPVAALLSTRARLSSQKRTLEYANSKLFLARERDDRPWSGQHQIVLLAGHELNFQEVTIHRRQRVTTSAKKNPYKMLHECD
jgi:hypothetical protein